MFRCTAGHMTKHGERRVLVVVETRPVEYVGKDDRGDLYLAGIGHETVKEVPMCEACAKRALVH